MLPRNHPDRIQIAFDDHRLVVRVRSTRIGSNTSRARAMARAMVVGPRVVGYPGG